MIRNKHEITKLLPYHDKITAYNYKIVVVDLKKASGYWQTMGKQYIQRDKNLFLELPLPMDGILK